MRISENKRISLKNKSLSQKNKAFDYLADDGTLHLYINLKSGKSTLRILLVTFRQQNQFVYRNPNIFPWSVRSVWYH